MPGGAQNCNSLTIWPKRFSRLYAFWPTNIWAGSLCTITMFSPRKLPQSSHPVVNRTQLTYSPRPPTLVWCRLWKRGGRSETTVPPASPSGCKCSRTAHNWRRWRSVSGSDQTNSVPACCRWFCDCTTGNKTTGKWRNKQKHIKPLSMTKTCRGSQKCLKKFRGELTWSRWCPGGTTTFLDLTFFSRTPPSSSLSLANLPITKNVTSVMCQVQHFVCRKFYGYQCCIDHTYASNLLDDILVV